MPMVRRRGSTACLSLPLVDDSATLREVLPHVAMTYAGTKDQKQSVRILEESLRLLGLDQSIASIRTRQLDALVLTLSQRGLSSKTINRYLAPVSKCLGWAHARDLIAGMPKVPRLREGPGRDTVLSSVDEERLIAWFAASERPDMAVIVRVLLATGFRASELLSRQPRHLRNGWLYLERGETKNDDPRAIPLSDDLAGDLAVLLSKGMPAYNTVWHWFKRARKTLGLPGITAHVLRHTAATRLNACGLPTATLKEYMGHRSVVTTLKYVKVQKDSIRQAAEMLRASSPAQALVSQCGAGCVHAARKTVAAKIKRP